MELEELKKISCSEYLHSLGFSKDKRSNNNFSFFKSPFRKERTASLAINERKNTWVDYGAGFGGDIIRLLMICEKIDFKTAIENLHNSSFEKITISNINTPKIVINEVKELTNNNLLNYLRFERKIDCDLAKKYLKEVHFENNSKKQYAIGFENDKKGFELRNKFLKIASSPKWVTTIKGTETINVFEGFMDFLSAMTYFNCEPKETVVVLNSVYMIDKVDLTGKLKFWGDSDASGDECFKKINAIDQRHIFKGYKDFNEFLCQVGSKQTLKNEL